MSVVNVLSWRKIKLNFPYLFLCCMSLYVDHRSMLDVRRFFFVMLRTSVCFGAEKSGGRLLCLFTPCSHSDVSVSASLLEGKRETLIDGFLYTKVIHQINKLYSWLKRFGNKLKHSKPTLKWQHFHPLRLVMMSKVQILPCYCLGSFFLSYHNRNVFNHHGKYKLFFEIILCSWI